MNNLLREAEDKLEDAVNPFAELKSVWVRYMYSNCIYVPVFTICNHHDHVIGCVLGVSEFSLIPLTVFFFLHWMHGLPSSPSDKYSSPSHSAFLFLFFPVSFLTLGVRCTPCPHVVVLLPLYLLLPPAAGSIVGKNLSFLLCPGRVFFDLVLSLTFP